MNTLNVLYHLALADFYERARRYRFLLTLAAVIFMGVLVNNGTLLVQISPSDPNMRYAYMFRGEFNSAWIGTMTVLLANTFLGLLGFYLVSDSIKRDISTGVGQIIATTPVSRAAYLLGKWFSNTLVLSVLVLILATASVIMVLLQGQAALDLGALLMPFLAVALPYMVLTAAFALVFESVPWLRGAVGNVVYFFLYIFIVSTAMIPTLKLPVRVDPLGVKLFSKSIIDVAAATYPNQTVHGISIGFATPVDQYKVFNWPGLAWDPGIIAGQWVWAAIGLGLILLSAMWFARFDPAREGHSRAQVKNARVQGKAEELEVSEPAAPRRKIPGVRLPTLSPLVSWLAQASPFLGVLFAELRLLLNGRRWWWWLVTAGLSFAILISPLETVKGYLLPFAWLWPLAIWSEMGNREQKNNTYQMVFSSARPVLRQLPAAWLAGVLATALFSAAVAVFSYNNGGLLGLAGWVGAIVFIPALALALGVASSGNRVFEVVYLIWWYAGPLEKMPGLDFTAGPPQVYLLAAAGLLALSAFWRGRQVRV